MFCAIKRVIGMVVFVFLVIVLKGQEFKSVKIGNQVWMASNYRAIVPGSWAYNEDPAWKPNLEDCTHGRRQ
ncbi:MAG: hypothetical protein HC905_15610 [Bacteroidales bacterium]|nr:hypothetical protein [Bacteroidales bacterium]